MPVRNSRLKAYHLVWLSVHPERTAEWLSARLKEGFHIHHADGDHSNNAPSNLILVEGNDHTLVLHGWNRRKDYQSRRRRAINDGKLEEVAGSSPLERILAGASKGGRIRAKILSKRTRKQIAQHAARKRWAKHREASTS